MESIDERINRIFCEIFGISENQIADSVSYNSLETWDSLRHLQLIAALEKEFTIKFKMDDVINMENFKLVRDTVKQYL